MVIVTCEARLVANGSTQLTGIDVDETFSPVVKPATIRTVLSLALSRTIGFSLPGFRDSQHPDHVCLLQRSLYGLKQAPRAWFQRFAAYAARVGFIHSRCDTSLFIYRRGSDTAYLLLYVDDIILTASSTVFLQTNTFGDVTSQQKLLLELLERAALLIIILSFLVDTDSKLSADGDLVSDPTLYRSLAGALQYLTFTRPDIYLYAVQAGLSIHRMIRRELFYALMPDLAIGLGQVTFLAPVMKLEYRCVAIAVAENLLVLRNLLRELS
ncbi:ribonuclease H-like domain-containing protein [Tanacetum coccineum]